MQQGHNNPSRQKQNFDAVPGWATQIISRKICGKPVSGNFHFHYPLSYPRLSGNFLMEKLNGNAWK